MKHRSLIQCVLLVASAAWVAVGCSGGEDGAFSEEAFEDESALRAGSALEADDALEAEDALTDEAEELGTSQQALILPRPFPPIPQPRPFEPCALFCPLGNIDTESCTCGPSPFFRQPLDPCATMRCVSGQCVNGRCE